MAISKNNTYIIIGAIVVALLLIAFGIWATGTNSTSPNTNDEQNTNGLVELNEVTENDWIRGNIDATVTLVEYSDLECPFCKTFHRTMNQTIDTYEPSELAWVYRHFPLESIHPQAPQEAHAAECAGALGGDEAFWGFVDEVYAVTESNNTLDLDRLPDIAEDVGLDREEFIQCQESGNYEDAVQEDYQDAIQAGGRGTPYNVLITSDGDTFQAPGALPPQMVQAVVDILLESVENDEPYEQTRQKVNQAIGQ